MIDTFEKTYTDWSIDVGEYKYEGKTFLTRMRILRKLNISVLIKMVIKYMKVTIMSLREFLGFLIKLPILKKSLLRSFIHA